MHGTVFDDHGKVVVAILQKVTGSSAGFMMNLRHYSDKQPGSRAVFEDISKGIGIETPAVSVIQAKAPATSPTMQASQG